MKNKYWKAAMAGLIATVPMTLAMVALHRRLPPHERYPLPPVQITREIAKRVGVEHASRPHTLTGPPLLAHFAYGAAVGALYAPLAQRLRLRAPAARAAAGAAYGVGVWVLSYLGWIPALRILAPATRHPARRNALMIFAHVVWGISLDTALRSLRGSSAPPRPTADPM